VPATKQAIAGHDSVTVTLSEVYNHDPRPRRS
jgi:hypothetical protein